MTPLMSAAVGGADDTVAFLLSNGASPDLVDKCHRTALENATDSRRVSTTVLLAPLTKNGRGGALAFLDAHPTEVTPAIQDLLRREALDQNALPYLIFVTDTRTVSVEKKAVMWRNFKFLYMTDEEKSKISPHVD